MLNSAQKTKHPDRHDRLTGATTAQYMGAQLAPLIAYLWSFGLVAAAAGVSALTYKLASSGSLTLIFLIAVVFSAQRHGLWPAVLTSLLSVLCWDYFFTLPYYELYFSDPRDYFALITFLSASLIISGMTEQIRRQSERLSTLAESVSDLYRLSQEFSHLATIDDLASFVVSRVGNMLTCEAVVVLRNHGDHSAPLIFPSDQCLEPNELAAAGGTFLALSVSNRLDRDPGSRFAFAPLNTNNGRIGSVGISRPAEPELTGAEREELDAFLSMAALAMERAWLARDIEYAKMSVETERLRNALLTSVSHDLRTPLTTIIGALSTLESLGHSMSPADRDELLASAHGEAERLNRFVGNLLDVAKLESGTLAARLVSTDLSEIVDVALERARPLLAQHQVRVAIAEDIPPASADAAMLEQVIFNVLDNAAKYSPADSEIRITGKTDGESVVLEIADRGEGVPDGAHEALFDKFTRFTQGDTKRPGTGLGLMICRGFLQTMDGSITAASRSDGCGTAFTIRLQRAFST
jgi:two-component system, OmpR family, sensor histidine kinase KdpD